jgi:hypothetical protein
MKKCISLLSALLTATLMLAAMSAASAAREISLQADGTVTQAVPNNSGSPLVRVMEGGIDWSDLSNLSVFAGAGYLCPGAAGTYDFTLTNLSDKEITYTFTAKGLLDGAPSDLISFSLSQPVQGTVPGFGSVPFTLRWEWAWEQDNPRDTALGAQSASRLTGDDPRIPYRAELEFIIEMDEPAPGKECEWPDWLLPGIGTALAGGGLLAALASVPLWLLPLALPAIAAAWCRAKQPSICPPFVPAPALPDSPVVPGPVPPPKTGDSWDFALLAGLGMALSMGVMIAILRERRAQV